MRKLKPVTPGELLCFWKSSSDRWELASIGSLKRSKCRPSRLARLSLVSALSLPIRICVYAGSSDFLTDTGSE